MFYGFTGISVWRAVFPLRIAFSHNLASRDRVETLVVVLRTSRDGVGCGQALPRDYLTGETIASAMDDIITRWWPQLREMRLPDSYSFASALELLRPLYHGADSARCCASYAAVDVAALDALATDAGKAVEWPNAAKASIPLVGVIPSCSPGKARALAKLFTLLGYRRIKVKVGKDRRLDRERVNAIRRAVGKECTLYADANAAWTGDEAVDRLAELRELEVTLVEEPLASGPAAETDYRDLEVRTGVDIMADESLCTLDDAKQLLARGSPSWWNLRVAKNGGFSGIAALDSLARTEGIRRYGGILVGETGILAAAAKAAAFGMGVECSEYGFSRIFMRGDPFRGSPSGYAGRFAGPGPAGAGLGTHLVLPALERCGKMIFTEGI